MKPSNIPNDVFIKALTNGLGIITEATRYLNSLGYAITRQAVDKRAKRHFAKELAELRSVAIDTAEFTLYELMKADKHPRIRLQAAQFILTTLGKSRGFGETVEHSGGLTIKWHEEKTYISPKEPDTE